MVKRKILFTHSYFLHFDPKQKELGQPYPPLGTLWAASVMRNAGYEVAVHDTMFQSSADSIINKLDQFQPDFLVIYDDGFNYLTKMCLSNMQEAAFRMIELAVRKNIPVLLSSSDSTDHFERYIEKGAAAVLLGEADETIRHVFAKLENAESLTGVAGVAYRDSNGKIVANPRRPVIRELDELPLPAWDLLEIQPYKKTWKDNYGYFSINMGTTRGCPYKCNWCAKPIYGNRYNSRSPEQVVEELTLLTNRFSFDHIWFSDDIFGLKPGWVKSFADLVQAKGLKFSYKIQSRADLLSNEEYVKDLARSGCTTAWIGAESGSQKILDAMDKGITVKEIYEANRLLRKHGIRPAFFLQFGYPGETMDDIMKTLKMLDDCLPHDIGISVSYPLPGTKFYETVKEELKVKSNWTDSDELALMFKNTYEPQFYKQLHRYVHKRYRQMQGWESSRKLLFFSSRDFSYDFRRTMSLLYYIPATLREKMKLNKFYYA